MSAALDQLPKPAIFGRSSSHFTRVTRIFAGELGVDYTFHVVSDLMSSNPDDYGGNPALRLPTLRTPRGDLWFGALNICRELERQSTRALRIIWPDDLDQPLLANTQELVTQAMATEVALILGKLGTGSDGGPHQSKLRKSLLNMMSWLEANAGPALAALPALSSLPADRTLSYLEVTLFCLVTHLEFREVLPVAPYPQLNEFCRGFGARPSLHATTYRFDT
jgi:glutathione S-transferase